MKITVIGTGYVGLVTGTCFSEIGNNVTCVDIDNAKVEKLNEGFVTIYEPGLEKIFLKNIKENRLKFTTDLEAAIDESEIIFLALPTPQGADGSADLKYVLGVAEDLGNLLKSYRVIVNKSTVPVGTAEKVRAVIAKNYSGEFDVVSNPEFLREGVAVDDFMKPDRIVIGSGSNKAVKLMQELYRPIVNNGATIIIMDELSSELTKYASNSFLAMKISFINEIANICELSGANIKSVREGIGSDNRIGPQFLIPGIGYGGSCFPKDVRALLNSSKELNYNFKILEAVEKVNDSQKIYLVNKISKHYNKNLKGKHFALWGLSFKPDTDDIRESSALSIIYELLETGSSITAFDPQAINNLRSILGNKITYADNPYQALDNADALIIATEWAEFRNPDLKLMEKLLPSKVIFDGRNIFDSDLMATNGYKYYYVGGEEI